MTRGQRKGFRHTEETKAKMRANAKANPKNVRHGLHKSHEYICWSMMKARCSRPTATGFSYYGGRGITVCDRWQTFDNFYADMGPAPTPTHTLDRWPNGDGNYEPGNVRWATKKEQSENSRPPRGRKLTIEMVHEIRKRLREGMARKQIATDLAVSWDTITDIALGRTWKGR